MVLHQTRIGHVRVHGPGPTFGRMPQGGIEIPARSYRAIPSDWSDRLRVRARDAGHDHLVVRRKTGESIDLAGHVKGTSQLRDRRMRTRGGARRPREVGVSIESRT